MALLGLARAGKKSAPGEPIVDIFHGKEVTGLVVEASCGFEAFETGDYVRTHFRKAVDQVFLLVKGQTSSSSRTSGTGGAKMRRI